MQAQLVECVPNFSNGRSPELLLALEHALRAVPAAKLLDASRDADHNRAVLTFVAPLDEAAEAALAMVRVATDSIDLRKHKGVHPRIGATDVLPFVPLAGCSEADCVGLAHQVGQRIAEEHGIPVFFYGAAAMRPQRRDLPDVRRGGFEGLLDRVRRGESIDADCGPSVPHTTAGACAVGVRPFLLAYNINLESNQIALARAIAGEIREANAGLPGVRALGLWLEGQGVAQVSINLIDYRRTGLLQVFERVEELARRAGVGIRESELIGLAPAAALDAELAKRIRLTGFDQERHIVEERIKSINAVKDLRSGGR